MNLLRHAATLSVLALMLAPAAPAAAEEATTLISLDGKSFSPAPDGALFPADLVLVPGSRYTQTFWVLNGSGRAADLRIFVGDTASSDADFIEQLTLRAQTQASPDTNAVALEPGASCTPLLEGELLRSQTVTEISITLAMRDDVGNSHQGATAGTTLTVSLTDPGVPGPAAGCSPGGGIPLTAEPDEEDPAGGSASGGSFAGGGRAGGAGDPSGDGTSGDTAVDTPMGAAAPPDLEPGFPVLFPWIALGAAVLAGGILFGLRQRKELPGE